MWQISCPTHWSFGFLLLSLSLLGSWDEAYIFMKVIHEPLYQSLFITVLSREGANTHSTLCASSVTWSLGLIWVMVCSWWAFLLWKVSSSCSIHPEESSPSIDLFFQPLVLIYSPSASSQVHLYSNCQALKWHATFRTRLFSVNAVPIVV